MPLRVVPIGISVAAKAVLAGCDIFKYVEDGVRRTYFKTSFANLRVDGGGPGLGAEKRNMVCLTPVKHQSNTCLTPILDEVLVFV